MLSVSPVIISAFIITYQYTFDKIQQFCSIKIDEPLNTEKGYNSSEKTNTENFHYSDYWLFFCFLIDKFSLQTSARHDYSSSYSPEKAFG